jgi:transposase InsO family protein
VQLHRNAKLSPVGRELLVTRIEQEGWTVADAAEAAGVSDRTAYKWLARFRAEGLGGLVDRPSAPKRVPGRTPRRTEQVIERLRRLRKSSIEIADALHMALSTVGAVLTRLGLGRLARLEAPEPPNRYCRRHAGELIHLDVKKLGRFDRPGHRMTRDRQKGRSYRVGWEFVHVCVDDATRLAYVEVLADEKGPTAVGFLERALAFFARHGVVVCEVMSDNGSCYRSKVFAAACRRHGLRHVRTRPYRPRTNGKAERFIRTMLEKWAYAASYHSSVHRRRALPGWVAFYNHERPHSALGRRSPLQQLERLRASAA